MSMTAKRKRGRPANPMPEHIDASPERIARVILSAPSPKKWPYLEWRGGKS